MISYLSGILAEAGEKGIVVETGGIGYSIIVPVSFLDGAPPAGSNIKVYTHLHITEDAVKLYGFRHPEDREIFRLLIGISGVGPKAAIGVLGGMTAGELRLAVLSDDEKRIARTPGLGPKTAKKIILELKDKFKLSDIGSFIDDDPVQSGHSEREDAMQALVALGYSPSESLSLISKLGDISGLSSDEILSLALKKKFS